MARAVGATGLSLIDAGYVQAERLDEGKQDGEVENEL
jgi:hypothetical protein